MLLMDKVMASIITCIRGTETQEKSEEECLDTSQESCFLLCQARQR